MTTTRSARRAWFLYVVASLGVIAAAGWLLGLWFASPAERRAIRMCAAVAFAVQLVTFAIARRWSRTNVIAGWGLGMLLRFAAVAAVALLGGPALGGPARAAALISLA